MDFRNLSIGVGFLIAAYLLFWIVKNDQPSSEKTNWEGPTLSTYIGLWGSSILCAVVGVAYIFKSLQS